MTTSASRAPASLTGRVTDDQQRPVPEVLVSDGLHVTRTDADGRFVLPGHGPFVMLTVPSDWTTDRWFVPADAPSLDFVLTPSPQSLPLTFVHVSDLHVTLADTATAPDGSDAMRWLGTDGAVHERAVTSPAVIAELFDDLAAQVPQAAFVAATGDLTNTGADQEYAAWCAAAGASRLPVVAIPGNHDHHGQDDELAHDQNVDFTAFPGRWEQYLGPRWFSFDHSGVHVVAIDWFTHLLGVDDEVQEAWLHADLAATDPGQPVILLSHDQMSSEFFARLPRQPIGTFSGHWHTSRVARVDGTLHVNTPTATFGGLDYSPATFRIATWDGAQLSVRTQHRQAPLPDAEAEASPNGAVAPRTSATPFARLPGTVLRAGPVLVGELVIATSSDEDQPAGWVTAIGRDSGQRRWQVTLASAVKSSPAVADDAVVVTAVTGETVCIELDGTIRWRRELDDPLRLWAHLRPVVHDGLVIVGEVARLAALELATGDVAWMRDDLGPRQNLTALADPVVVDGTLLVAYTGQTPALRGLDPATGEDRWPLGVATGSIYVLPPEQRAGELASTVMAPPAPDGDDVLVVRLGATIQRVRAADGTVVWSNAHHGWFNPGRLAVLEDRVIAVAGTGHVRAYDRGDGRLLWDTTVGHSAPLAAGAYRREGRLSLGGVTAVTGGVLVTTGDGSVVALDADGRVTATVLLSAPALGAIASDGRSAWTVTVDGALHRLDLPLNEGVRGGGGTAEDK